MMFGAAAQHFSVGVFLSSVAAWQWNFFAVKWWKCLRPRGFVRVLFSNGLKCNRKSLKTQCEVMLPIISTYPIEGGESVHLSRVVRWGNNWGGTNEPAKGWYLCGKRANFWRKPSNWPTTYFVYSAPTKYTMTSNYQQKMFDHHPRKLPAEMFDHSLKNIQNVCNIHVTSVQTSYKPIKQAT